MGKKADKKLEWQEAKRRCDLSDEEIRMAKELGFHPYSLIKNIPSKSQLWKAPVREWIRNRYAKRFGKTRRPTSPKAPHGTASPAPPADFVPEIPADEDVLPQYDTHTGEIYYTRVSDDHEFTPEEARRNQEEDTRAGDVNEDEAGDFDELLWRQDAEPTHDEVGAADQRMLRRHRELRQAAEAVAAAFSRLAVVEKVVLFGSVAKPLQREVPRFREFERARIELFHECNDVDLAVWVSSLTELKTLQKARSHALNELLAQQHIGVAHHQVDVFLLEPGTDRYWGRLCLFGQCPKGKKECRVDSCGATPFLQEHQDFVLNWSLAAPGSVLLYAKPAHSDSDAAGVPVAD
jgi:predicted nucleotidyltransferase